MLNFFFFNDTATTEIYTLSLHDALPIYCLAQIAGAGAALDQGFRLPFGPLARLAQNEELGGARGDARRGRRLEHKENIMTAAGFYFNMKGPKTQHNFGVPSRITEIKFSF